MSGLQFVQDDIVKDAFAELPVPVATMRWSRGNGLLSSVLKTDPGLYLGGWKARVDKFGSDTGEKNPLLPYPIVERTDAKGKVHFQVYATPVVYLVIIGQRERWELREKEFNQKLGFDTWVVKHVSVTPKVGYQPILQVFGLAFHETTEEHCPVLLWIDAKTTRNNFNKASQMWKNFPGKEGFTVIRGYGTHGEVDPDTGLASPRFEEYHGGSWTPVEPIGPASPRWFQITQELVDLKGASKAWRVCPRWHEEGRVGAQQQIEVEAGESDAAPDPFLEKFAKRAKEIGLTNIEIEQIMNEAAGNYEKAYGAISDQSTLTSLPNIKIDNPFTK